MTILITGSSGKTASRLTPILPASHVPLVASRSGKPTGGSTSYPTVQFDWTDEKTWIQPFEHEQAKKSPITAAYLVGPIVVDAQTYVNKFISFVQGKGVKRFVFLSSSSVDADGPMHGETHAYLRDNAEEWTVLRPSWFMENFSQSLHRVTIKDEGKTYSAAKNGKIPFIACEDIAAIACRALVSDVPYNTDLIIRGPELLTYDEVAAIFTEILGKKVEHVMLQPDDRTAKFELQGVPRSYAEMLTRLDVAISEGAENAMNNVVEDVLGKKPKKFIDFVKENREVWL